MRRYLALPTALRIGLLASLGGLLVLALDMMALIQPAAANVPPPAAVATGPLTYRSGTFTLRLTEQPCPFPELREPLEEEGIPPARVYETTSIGRKGAGCYTHDMQGDVLTLDLGGQDAFLPLKWFKRDPRV